MIGAPTDIHSSFLRGPAAAPSAIRAALASEHGNAAAESGIELGIDVMLDDAGDLPLTEGPGDDALIEAAVAKAAGEGTLPLVLGGDHSISVPVVAALAALHGPLDILHFDAHPDLYDNFGGDPRSHASPFARVMEAGHARRLVQIGIRTMNRHCREQAARFGVEAIEMRDFTVGRVPELAGPLYLSIDIDGFDPACAPGVSHPEPGGLTVREVLAALERQTAPLVGADIVELNPSRDPSGITAILAAKLVKEIASLYVRNGRAA
ncbi:MAG: agmatinase [Sphingomonadaceae bacterium]|nr:agmatinase [Sphingomonadaceae bacterium]